MDQLVKLLGRQIQLATLMATLEQTNRTMPYGEAAVICGFGEWRPGERYPHRFSFQQLMETLDANDIKVNGERTINWSRLVNADTGRPSPGMLRLNRIVRDPAPNPAVAELAMATIELEA
jgi:hypothetical protein